MYAVIGTVGIDPSRGDEAEKMLHSDVVPMVKQAPGFIRAVWVRSEDGTSGHAFILFDTEENAKAAAAMAQQPPEDGPITSASNAVFRVLAEA